MKFFDSVGDPKTDSMFNFICNVICMAVLAPVKLIREIMKKAVYLSRAQIDKLFFTSICFGLFFTVLSVAIRYSKKQFSLLTGRLLRFKVRFKFRKQCLHIHRFFKLKVYRL
jgi:hypothetical protein